MVILTTTVVTLLQLQRAGCFDPSMDAESENNPAGLAYVLQAEGSRVRRGR